MTDNKIASFIYNLLLNQSWAIDDKHFGRLWNKAWERACRHFCCPVSTNVHGRRVLVNFGHSYPLYARRFRNWNNPLIELAHESFRTKGHPVGVVDVGAGVGDTVLLLESNCPGMVEEFFCVEGDSEFFEYLTENTRQLKNVRVSQAMLSDQDDGEISSLVRTHPGTASAQGPGKVQSATLDSILLRSNVRRLDVLKIDVDGYDGKVLLGAEDVLSNFRPAVIFEWHPIMCQQAGNDWTDHFRILGKHGYNRFIWFTKYGDFSHFMDGFDAGVVGRLADLCLRGRHDYDWHYDVVALHADSAISDIALAELAFGKARKSWY